MEQEAVGLVMGEAPNVPIFSSLLGRPCNIQTWLAWHSLHNQFSYLEHSSQWLVAETLETRMLQVVKSCPLDFHQQDSLDYWEFFRFVSNIAMSRLDFVKYNNILPTVLLYLSSSWQQQHAFETIARLPRQRARSNVSLPWHDPWNSIESYNSWIWDRNQ